MSVSESNLGLPNNQESVNTLFPATISTGSLRLDIALSIGGLPLGEFCEIAGPMTSGKTTLCLHTIAESQKHGGVCAFIDVDHMLDVRYAANCGVNVKQLLVFDPMYAEDALGIVQNLCLSGAVEVIVVDSINSLVPKAEFDPYSSINPKEFVDHLLSHYLQRLTSCVKKFNQLILFTNCIPSGKENIYHNLNRNPSRLALKLHAAVRLGLSFISLIQKNNLSYGEKINVRIIKNKFAPCQDSVELDIMYNNGINAIGEIIEFARDLGVIKREGEFFIYHNQQVGKDQKDLIDLLTQHPSQKKDLELEIRQLVFTNEA
jgi:recombination protein RecA